VQNNKDRNLRAKTPDQNLVNNKRNGPELPPPLKETSQVAPKNNVNWNNIRPVYPVLQELKEKAQVVTLAQKQKAERDIAEGNYRSSGSDYSGGFDSGVDDNNEATGQDQYD
jgi:hypothetical protein